MFRGTQVPHHLPLVHLVVHILHGTDGVECYPVRQDSFLFYSFGLPYSYIFDTTYLAINVTILVNLMLEITMLAC